MNIRELTLESLKANDLVAARAHCDEWLRIDPKSGQAWHLLGVCHAQGGELADAIRCFSNATENDPTSSLYPYNLAVAQKLTGDLEKAIAAFRLAIDRRGDFFESRINLGVSLEEAGRKEEAIECFRAAVDQFPDSADANFNLANMLSEAGRIDEAACHYRQAIELDPNHSAAHENLGRAFLDAERFDEAKEVWTQWLSEDPSNATAKHMLASISGEAPPPRCDDQCIREAFDERFAENFDRKLARLDYQSPQLIADVLEKIELPNRKVDVLDCGCGTGLCGPLLRPLASKLVGVDLSKAMLDQAFKRQLYDQLHECEITQFMSTHPCSFDVVISADTLCYFGELDEVLRSASQCLKPGGVMIFTLESLKPSTLKPSTRQSTASADLYQLCPHGRYTHSREYVAAAVQGAGLERMKISKVVQRFEIGRPVEGWLVSARQGSGK
ncbi:TPR repeat-containing protein YrrB [Planctomycetes bacterium CA13]|uniref:TPR repeat-containing protein YrrB n=1 Tax=Novipirellula herctigrandis TaxID=2527986 RepID=A0A5C5Z671_9BACT|nr:TPR repeat-containing protein YrrB [Planctomycetes bacterium CA13]